MPSPSQLTLTICTAALVAGIGWDGAPFVSARNVLVSESRSGFAELTTTASDLPDEVLAAGNEAVSLWKHFSERVVFEAGSLFQQLRAKAQSHA